MMQTFEAVVINAPTCVCKRSIGNDVGFASAHSIILCQLLFVWEVANQDTVQYTYSSNTSESLWYIICHLCATYLVQFPANHVDWLGHVAANWMAACLLLFAVSLVLLVHVIQRLW